MVCIWVSHCEGQQHFIESMHTQVAQCCVDTHVNDKVNEFLRATKLCHVIHIIDNKGGYPSLSKARKDDSWTYQL